MRGCCAFSSGVRAPEICAVLRWVGLAVYGCVPRSCSSCYLPSIVFLPSGRILFQNLAPRCMCLAPGSRVSSRFPGIYFPRVFALFCDPACVNAFWRVPSLFCSL